MKASAIEYFIKERDNKGPLSSLNTVLEVVTFSEGKTHI
jgi:hypothetical protein